MIDDWYLTSELTPDEPATPEYVLNVLRDQHRQEFAYDEDSDSSTELGFDTTVKDWLDAYDFLGWRDLAHALSREWRIDCSDAEWRAVLKPARSKRLSDVCGFIARRAIRPRVRYAGLLGAQCLAAGAFLTVRSLLARAGEDGDAIAPSTPLAEYTRRHCDLFLGPISRLSPGSLPLVRIQPSRTGSWATWAMLPGFIGLTVGAFGDLPFFVLGGVAVLVSAWSTSWFAAAYLLPRKVEFTGLKTFRDLAVAISIGDSA
jgi:hypothetical protein